MAAQCQASPLEVPGEGEKKIEEKEDDRRNHKEENTQEEKEVDEKSRKENVKGEEGLLQVKTEEVDLPTSFASQLPQLVQPLTPPTKEDHSDSDEDDQKLVEQKWRQQHGQEDSEEHDDEEFQNQLKQHFKDRVATEDPHILEDEELSATSPWQRRMEMRRNKKAQEGLDDATTATVPSLPPEKPELEPIKEELDNNEARSREIMGVKKKLAKEILLSTHVQQALSFNHSPFSRQQLATLKHCIRIVSGGGG